MNTNFDELPPFYMISLRIEKFKRRNSCKMHKQTFHQTFFYLNLTLQRSETSYLLEMITRIPAIMRVVKTIARYSHKQRWNTKLHQNEQKCVRDKFFTWRHNTVCV